MAYTSNKKQFDFIDPKTLGIIGIILIAVFTFGKSILNRFSSGLSFLGAKSDQKAIVNETLNNPTGVRYTYVKGVVDTVIKQLYASWYQNTDEAAIVAEMNKLQSAEEVIFASTYFNGEKGESLKAKLQDELDADWRMTAGSYSKLKSLVKTNLL